MRVSSQSWFAVVGVCGLAMTASIIGPKTKADDIKDVRLISPVPLPVTGTVGVTGAVNVSAISPLPVTGTVGISGPVNLSASGPVPVFPGLPPRAFTIPPTQSIIAVTGSSTTPDPSGTRYALTTIVVANSSNASSDLSFSAHGTNFGNCNISTDHPSFSPGPAISIGPHSTQTISFPEPYVTAPVTATGVCLMVSSPQGNGLVTWSVVGYKL
jgi:hypothetical protein